MKFTPRVTMRDVAKASGFHQSTVSLALRGDKRISEQTRADITAVANRLGYRPHPLVSAYAAACRASRKPSAGAGTVIACLLPDGKKDEAYVEGARAAALAQGYTLKPFSVGGSSLSPQRLNTILQTRNIHGVIIGPMPASSGGFDLDWQQLCTVAIEYTFVQPELDRVVHDSYSGMHTALAQCCSRGFRRVGLVLTQNGYERTLGLSDAAFWKCQKEPRSRLAAIAPLHLDDWSGDAFLRWYRRTSPQVVISSAALMDNISRSFKANARRIPRDVSLLSLNVFEGSGYSGINQNFHALGAMAARMVIDKLTRNDRGLPTVRQTVLVPGTWVEGRTLAAAHVASKE